jgi:RNA polymerase sigma-70 factor (ECF subfamily)
MEAESQAIVSRARRGDHRAAAVLIEQHYAGIYAFLRRLAGNDADAADLTQRTFGRFWQALPSFAGRSTLSSWLHGIAHHVYLDWVRANHRHEERSEAWWAARCSPEPRPDEVAIRDDLAARLYALVDELPADVRVTVHLHYYQELTLEETADALDIAASTVKYRLRQALAELQKSMAPEHTSNTFANSPRL